MIPQKHLLTFNVVSCQFALHYSFETETKARQALQNISLALAKGGHFFGTCPNSNWIVYVFDTDDRKKLRSIQGLHFGNAVYSITFDQKDEYPLFGHRYRFDLMDAIDDCPEYLIHFPTLVKHVFFNTHTQTSKRI